MPSIILGQPYASGGQTIISGNPWSGFNAQYPQTGIQFRWDTAAGGACYLALSGGPSISGQGVSGVGYLSGQTGLPGGSGGMTINSGGMMLSGGALPGLMDGFKLAPGDAYFLPRGVFRRSGVYDVYGLTDLAGSGGRLYFEMF